jgi:serine/threonine protein kinase
LFEGKEYREVIKKNTECEIDFDNEIYSNLCSEGMDLLRRMLEKDPERRIRASEALNHEFMRVNGVESSVFKEDCTVLSLNNIV